MVEARATLAALETAIRAAPPPAVIDASGLRALDTAALAVLLQCQRLARAAGHSLAVTGAPAKLVELARLYGAEDLLGLVPQQLH